MDGLGSNIGYQGSIHKLPAPSIAKPERDTRSSSQGEANLESEAEVKTTAVPSDIARIVTPKSPYQARLGYDKDRASVFVEIVNSATGNVIQRFPAESIAKELLAVTGRSGPVLADEIA